MLKPMAKHVKGRAIIAVCDLTSNPDMGRREQAESGTVVIYRGGHEVARNSGAQDTAFSAEMGLLGLQTPGSSL